MKPRKGQQILIGLMVLSIIILYADPSFAERATYFYDATGRLIMENETGTVSNYEYDKVGNLLSISVDHAIC